MTAIEHKEIKGITVRNMVVTIVSTASIVASVMTTYFNLKNYIYDVNSNQQTEHRINDMRLKLIETRITILEQQVNHKTPTP